MEIAPSTKNNAVQSANVPIDKATSFPSRRPRQGQDSTEKQTLVQWDPTEPAARSLKFRTPS